MKNHADAEIRRLESLAGSRKMTGDLAGALAARQSLEVIHDSNRSDAKTQVLNLTLLANLAVHVRNLHEGERAARKSLALCSGLADELRATCQMLLACVLAEARKFEEAIAFAEQAVELFESSHGSDSSFVKHRKEDLRRMHEKYLGSYLDL